MNKPLKIYIAGKVSGEPIATCSMKFGMAQKELEGLGHIAINPLALVNNWKAPWPEAMKICIKGLMDCDAVLFLPCHTESEGAKLELLLANKTQLITFFNLSQIAPHEK